MNKEMKQCLILLNDYRNRLTKQQKKVFIGQIKSGDYEGFKRGLFKTMMVKYIGK